jgi:hypothetical protein
MNSHLLIYLHLPLYADPAEIVDRKADGEGSYNYYVHYTEFDKRLDEWAPSNRVSRMQHVGSGDALARMTSGGSA